MNPDRGIDVSQTDTIQFHKSPNICMCTHACMQRDCSIVNYNHQKDDCQLSLESCEEVEVEPDFTVTYRTCLPVTINHCIQWVSVANVLNGTGIACDPNSSYQVGRLVLQDDILVGEIHNVYLQYTEAWRDGTHYYNADETEVLQLQPGCSAHWMPYIPGDPFPDRTVIGGYLGKRCKGIPIIRGLTSDGVKYRCGYYNSETQLGYMVYISPEIATEMDILVLVWTLLWVNFPDWWWGRPLSVCFYLCLWNTHWLWWSKLFNHFSNECKRNVFPW